MEEPNACKFLCSQSVFRGFLTGSSEISGYKDLVTAKVDSSLGEPLDGERLKLEIQQISGHLSYSE